MAGYEVDPEALRGAINKLKDTWERMTSLGTEARMLDPGELTANDAATKEARKAFNDRAASEKQSLQSFSHLLADKIKQKIDAYEHTLKEYEALDESAAESQPKV